MKTYLNELRGQVRGNARLRRRLDAKDYELRRMKAHMAVLVTMLDRLGYGDDTAVVRAAATIGWKRMREDVKQEIEKVFGVKL